MCKEKSSLGVVRIGLCLREFVVDTVITSPVVDAALVGDRVAEHEYESKNEMSFVGSM